MDHASPILGSQGLRLGRTSGTLADDVDPQLNRFVDVSPAPGNGMRRLEVLPVVIARTREKRQ